MSEIIESKFQCVKCHNFEAVYDFKDHQYKCEFCDHVNKMNYRTVRCPRCHSYHSEYTWFDPGRCVYCGHSYTE